MPYIPDALERFIGKKIEKYASAETAREMAMVAYQRALKLRKENDDIRMEYIIGIGLTCKLVKGEGERKGRKHEIYFASQSFLGSNSYSLKIKERFTREEEEKVASLLALYKIAELCDVHENDTFMKCIHERIEYSGDSHEEHAEVNEDTGKLLIDTLLSTEYEEKKSILLFNEKMERPSTYPKLILSASFYPCHKNHILMAEIASDKYHLPITFEMSLANVDKPPIDFISLDYRLKSLQKYMDNDFLDGMYLTNAPLFADKAILFPNSRFIIGSDTLNRLFNEDYYRENEEKYTLIEHFKKFNARFVVFQRKDIEPRVDEEILQICDIVPFEEYTDDGTSSTKIRIENRN